MSMPNILRKIFIVFAIMCIMVAFAACAVFIDGAIENIRCLFRGTEKEFWMLLSIDFAEIIIVVPIMPLLCWTVQKLVVVIKRRLVRNDSENLADDQDTAMVSSTRRGQSGQRYVAYELDMHGNAIIIREPPQNGSESLR